MAIAVAIACYNDAKTLSIRGKVSLGENPISTLKVLRSSALRKHKSDYPY